MKNVPFLAPVRLLLLVICWAFLVVGAAHAAPQSVYWADPIAGSDTTGTGDPAQPFGTITKALSVSLPGDAVYLKPGQYSPLTGESFPLIVPRGVHLVDPTRAQAAQIRGTKFSAQSGENVLQLSNTGHAAAFVSFFIGFGIWGGDRGIVYNNQGMLAASEIIIEDVTITATSLVGLRFTVKDADLFRLTCKRVDILRGENGFGFDGPPTNSVKLAVRSGELEAEFSDCALNGFLSGMIVESRNGASSGAARLSLSGVRFVGLNMAGLACIADEGSTIRTKQTHCLYFECGVHPINPWHGAIVDDKSTNGIFHAIVHTIFNENMTDVQKYQAHRYSLGGNVYHHQMPTDPIQDLPGGFRTAEPGFVLSGVDFHLTSAAAARNQTASSTPGHSGGDIDGDFANTEGGACFDGSIDAGPDEYREFSLYRRGRLSKGELSKWRVLGPVSGAGPLPLRAALVLGTAAALSECPTGPELDFNQGFSLLGLVALDAAGVADFLIDVPDQPGLVGLPLALQVGFVDPNLGALTGYSRVLETAVGW